MTEPEASPNRKSPSRRTRLPPSAESEEEEAFSFAPLKAERTLSAETLALWRHPVPRTRIGVFPTSDRPNPCVVGDLVLASLCNPGRIIALDRETGERRWSKRLAYYGNEHVYAPPGSELVYGGTFQELLAIEPARGKVRWTFSPYGRNGESLYSSPTLFDGRLFLGDRSGYLHCLSAESGERLWSAYPSRARNNDINSTPLATDGLVIAATNSRLALAYDPVSGQEVWRQRLDGPCGSSIQACGEGALLYTFGSAYLLSRADGRVMERWKRRGRQVDQACAAGELAVLLTRRDFGPGKPLHPVTELRAYRGSRELYSHAYPYWSGPWLWHEPATGKVYEATNHGLGILDPETVVREAVIVGLDVDKHGNPSEDTGPPTVSDGVLYVLTERGTVLALRHP